MISIVVSVFNEEEALPIFTETLLSIISQLPFEFEVIFVNDGSTDNSLQILKELSEKHPNSIKAVSFSRNYGHEAAMIAGLDVSSGDAVICMDSDLQHPPDSLEEMLANWQNGSDIVLMIRSERDDEGIIRKALGGIFYRLLNAISDYKILKNASDFFLIDKKVKLHLTADFRENVRFLRGYIQNIGFKISILTYKSPDRVAGFSNYNLLSLYKLSFHAITAFSTFPLQLGLLISFLIGIFSLIALLYSVVMYFYGNPVSGYTTIVVLMSLYFAILFFLIGLIGKYIAILFEEVKGRPLYIIDKLYNFKDEAK